MKGRVTHRFAASLIAALAMPAHFPVASLAQVAGESLADGRRDDPPAGPYRDNLTVTLIVN